MWQYIKKASICIQVVLYLLFVIFGWLVIRLIQGAAWVLDALCQSMGTIGCFQIAAQISLGAFANGAGWAAVAKTLHDMHQEAILEEKKNGIKS